MTRIRLMHAKLHRVRVTDANVNYVGSVTIDTELIEMVGILPLQEVEIWNVSNGNRLSTYVLPGEPGSGKRATHPSGKGERPFTLTDKVISKGLNASRAYYLSKWCICSFVRSWRFCDYCSL